MVNQYFVECPRGHRITVELYQSGLSVRCPVCNADTSVPDSVTLKERSGDKYPLLVPIDKIRRQIDAHEFPFDGTCVECGAAESNVTIPILYRSMIERQLDDERVVGIGLSGFKFTASGGVEYWDEFEIPLCLCETCFESFQSGQRFQKRKRWFLSSFVWLTLIGFLILAYFQLELIAALSGILWFVGLLAWIAGLQSKKRVDPTLNVALEKINWLKEAVAESMELQMTVGEPRHLSRKA